eukprot:1689058-Pleurochrysis_carterae.AAC.1
MLDGGTAPPHDTRMPRNARAGHHAPRAAGPPSKSRRLAGADAARPGARSGHQARGTKRPQSLLGPGRPICPNAPPGAAAGGGGAPGIAPSTPACLRPLRRLLPRRSRRHARRPAANAHNSSAQRNRAAPPHPRKTRKPLPATRDRSAPLAGLVVLAAG